MIGAWASSVPPLLGSDPVKFYFVLIQGGPCDPGAAEGDAGGVGRIGQAGNPAVAAIEPDDIVSRGVIKRLGPVGYFLAQPGHPVDVLIRHLDRSFVEPVLGDLTPVSEHLAPAVLPSVLIDREGGAEFRGG